MVSKETKIMQILAEEIRKDIDDQVLSDLQIDNCKKLGWTGITLTNMRKKLDAGMNEWLAENCKGQFFCSLHNKSCYFENAKDAVMFTLRWSQ